jgi:hypothetical protein
MKHVIPIFAIFLAIVLGVHPAQASTDSKANRIFHRLKQLPLRAAPYHRVQMLVTHLAKLDPKNTYKYYHLGTSRISYADGRGPLYTTRLAAKVAKILKHSDLPPLQVAKILKQITKLEICYCPPPEPTP